MTLKNYQEKTVQWFGNTVEVARWKDEGQDHVEVMISLDQLEYYGRGPNEAIAFSNLEHEMETIANGQHLAEVVQYYNSQNREVSEDELDLCRELQSHAKRWIELHRELRKDFGPVADERHAG